jgi:hypothetical protein
VLELDLAHDAEATTPAQLDARHQCGAAAVLVLVLVRDWGVCSAGAADSANQLGVGSDDRQIQTEPTARPREPERQDNTKGEGAGARASNGRDATNTRDSAPRKGPREGAKAK